MNLFKLMATISLDSKDYDKGLNNAEKGISSFSSKMSGFSSKVGKFAKGMAVATGGALATIGTFGIKSAMELEASEAKYSTVFKGFTQQSDAFIKEFQKLTPATTAEARNMASGIQDMLIPMGVARDEATNMTGRFMNLSGALTNFNSGTETSESVVGKFQAALTGELSALKSLGIQLDVDTVKQKAVEMGLAATTKEVSKQAFAQVVLEESYRQSGDALVAYTEESLDAKTKFGLLKSELLDIGASMFTSLLPAINEVLGKFRDMLTDIKPVLDKVGKAVGFFIENIKLGISPMESIYGAVYNTFGQETADKVDKVAKAVWGLALMFMVLKGVMVVNSIVGMVGAFVSMIKPIFAAIKMVKSFSGAMAILNMVMMANPIGIVIGLIGALVGAFVYLMTTNTEFKDFIFNCWDAIKEFIGKSVEAIKVFFTETIPNAIDEMIKWFQDIPNKISEGIEKAKEKVKEFVEDIKTKFTEMVENTKEYVINWWNNLKESFSNGIQAIKDKLTEWKDNVVEFFTVTIPNAIQNTMQWFSELPYKIGYALGQALGSIVKWGIDTWNYFTTNIPLWIENISNWFSELPTRISEWLTQSWENTKQWGVDMWNTFLENCTRIIEGVKEWFSNIKETISNKLKESWENTKQWASDMWNKAKEMGSNFVNGIVDWFKQIPSKVSNWFNETVQKAIDLKNKMVNKAKEIGREFTTWLTDSIKDLPNKFMNIGKNIVEGVWNGIVGMKNWIMSKVSGFFSGILDGVKSVFGIHSPSRVFRDEIGKWIPAGVAVGIENGMPDLENTLNTEMGGLVDIAEPESFTLMNNGNAEIISLLKQLVAKETVLEIDGREVTRATAPYQEEWQEYSRIMNV